MTDQPDRVHVPASARDPYGLADTERLDVEPETVATAQQWDERCWRGRS